MKKKILFIAVLLTLCFVTAACGEEKKELLVGWFYFDRAEKRQSADGTENLFYLRYLFDSDGECLWKGEIRGVEYNNDGKLIYGIDNDVWYEYDDNGNMIHCIRISDSSQALYFRNYGLEAFIEKYKDNIIYDYEEWHEYDDRSNEIYYKEVDCYDGEQEIKEHKYEYNTKGQMIYYKKVYTYFDGEQKIEEYKYEYNTKGQMIREKLIDGGPFGEYIYEYDSKGNLIQKSNVFDYADYTRYEYDKKGNEIHRYDSFGLERWFEYDSKGNLIYEKTYYAYTGKYSEYWYDGEGNSVRTTDNGEETWPSRCLGDNWEYDVNNIPIRYRFSEEKWTKVKSSDGELEHWECTDGQEEWYDKNGAIVIRKGKDGKKTYYDYDYYKNGKVKAIYKSF